MKKITLREITYEQFNKILEGKNIVPGPLIHLGVCLVALLLYFDDRHRKYVLLLLPFAVLPDLDHLAPFYAPRLYFHNVFILVLPLAIALYALATKRGLLFDVGLMAGFCLLSHLVLDFFVGGTMALFYPLTTARYGFQYMSGPLFGPELKYKPNHGFYFESLSYNGLPLGIVLCVIAFAGVLVVRKHFQLTAQCSSIAQARKRDVQS
ncbi:MAG: metal-dependent hydrolase [Halobacteriota archaeon]